MRVFLWICTVAASPLAGLSFTDQARTAGVDAVGEANGAAFGDYYEDGWPELMVARLGRGDGPLVYHNQGEATFADQSALLADAAGPALGAASPALRGPPRWPTAGPPPARHSATLKGTAHWICSAPTGPPWETSTTAASPARASLNRAKCSAPCVPARTASAPPPSTATTTATSTCTFSPAPGNTRACPTMRGRGPLETDRRIGRRLQWHQRRRGLGRLRQRRGPGPAPLQLGETRAVQNLGEGRFAPVPALPAGAASRFFLNQGDGTFADYSAEAGLDAPQSSYAGVAGDYDQDGRLDLYVSRFPRQFNSLYRNEGQGRFANLTRQKNIVSYFRASGRLRGLCRLRRGRGRGPLRQHLRRLRPLLRRPGHRRLCAPPGGRPARRGGHGPGRL
ncbi:MAG: VCBS repeat-containing protein [Candidatus Handelsmanbacteria bacterium]|nr:VCBS repeat-containing protein [Candidatus Handelsmanbacteria bacterium]